MYSYVVWKCAAGNCTVILYCITNCQVLSNCLNGFAVCLFYFIDIKNSPTSCMYDTRRFRVAWILPCSVYCTRTYRITGTSKLIFIYRYIIQTIQCRRKRTPPNLQIVFKMPISYLLYNLRTHMIILINSYTNK